MYSEEFRTVLNTHESSFRGRSEEAWKKTLTDSKPDGNLFYLFYNEMYLFNND